MHRFAYAVLAMFLLIGFSMDRTVTAGGFLDLDLEGEGTGIDVMEDPDIVRERERREAEARRLAEEEARRQAEAEAARLREEEAEARRKEAEARRQAQAEARAARAAAGASGGGAALSREPPAVTPEVLFAGYLGGKGDQAFTEVEIRGNQIRARGGSLSLQVILNARGEFEQAIPSGSVNTNMDLPNVGRGTPRNAQLANSNVSYGFRQVHPILQQPYVNIGDITLWGWTNEQARDAKGRYAPYMSDSRIQLVEHGPIIDGKKTYFIVGWSDGGNSCFQGYARDRHIGSQMRGGLNTGGGGGTSSWVWLFNEEGEQVYPGFALRGHTHGVKFDSWRRAIIWGGGISRWNGPNPFNIMPDGAAVMMLSPDWSRWEFRQPMGEGGITAVEFDEISGIFAACGFTRNSDYTDGRGRERKAREFGQTNPVQTKPGDRYDAFLVVWRMWQPLRRPETIRGDAFEESEEPEDGDAPSEGDESEPSGEATETDADPASDGDDASSSESSMESSSGEE